MGKAGEEDKRSKPEKRYLIVVITWVIIFLWANNQRLWALIYTLKERERERCRDEKLQKTRIQLPQRRLFRSLTLKWPFRSNWSNPKVQHRCIHFHLQKANCFWVGHSRNRAVWSHDTGKWEIRKMFSFWLQRMRNECPLTKSWLHLMDYWVGDLCFPKQTKSLFFSLNTFSKSNIASTTMLLTRVDKQVYGLVTARDTRADLPLSLP